MKLLHNKVAVITGGTRGIGKSIVETFVKEGAIVVFTFIKSEKEAILIKKKLSIFSKIYFYKVDVTDNKSIKNFINNVLKSLKRIDILVNNAGIVEDSLLLRMNTYKWEKVINTNLNSVFYFTKEVVKTMLKQRNGSIINMSSIVGLMGNYGQSNYSASKAGIIGFTKSISKELGSRNIRCNVVAPGFINTDMTSSYLKKDKINDFIKNNISLKRIGEPKDVANVCLFLASNLSNYITGEVINISGGINL